MKKKIYDFVLLLPWAIRKRIVDLCDFCKSPFLCVTNRKQIRCLFKNTTEIFGLDDQKLSQKECNIWKKGLLYYALSSPRGARKIADNFCKCRIRTIKEGEMFFENSPILLCVVKDDLERIKLSYEHHKKIGVKNFIYIDNGSTDGTLEWLLEQGNVFVYQTFDTFIMWAKVAWISKVIQHFGFDRWYLIVDSDELFVYPDCENRTIEEYVAYMNKKKISRALSFMLDMYSTSRLFETENNENNILEKNRYFDGDSYRIESCLHYQKIIGGPRQRIFAKKGGMEMLQNKYPLIFYRKGDIYRYHYASPYRENFVEECTSVLLHYKFLQGDYAKYLGIVERGNYANGSRLYKDIIEKVNEGSELYFYYENSVEYQNSWDLLKTGIVKKWN